MFCVEVVWLSIKSVELPNAVDTVAVIVSIVVSVVVSVIIDPQPENIVHNAFNCTSDISLKGVVD